MQALSASSRGWNRMAPEEKQLKSEKFDLRMRPSELQLIREAAKALHIDTTAFIRRHAVAAAEAVLHDQRRFVVTEEQWNAINAAFEAPARSLPHLSKIMDEHDEWDDEE
jgi:uncharacterized protein (DUF1778 family)